MRTVTGLLIAGRQPRAVPVAARPGQQQHQAIQQALGVRTFDLVGLTAGIDLFVDDEGAVNGSRVNLAAAVLAHTLGTPGVLFGPALALAVDSRGDTIGLTAAQDRLAHTAISHPDQDVLAAIRATLRDAGHPLPR